ncbi:MAG: zf-TFIIB domain-containing protein [Nanoarchaeota archaeon]|nr:zf-TFIIB domain-containing protein [DPANN group archaeon]MBL7116879.1 zf-TFIIB domain-containing protein [Nanoarchaeota archaeon]
MFKWFRKNKDFDEVDLMCPRCSIIMRKIKKKDVIIDVCDRCNGMWLDDKEIDKLVEYAKHEMKKQKTSKKKKG